MPRLATRLIARASREHHLLPLILQSCRDLPSARRELAWLKEHAQNAKYIEFDKREVYLHQLCLKRSLGVPLQYLLGSEYFGDLEIICRPDVLIPRQETAFTVSYLINRLRDSYSSILPKHLSVLDLCTGTGCIPLLFCHAFPYKELGVESLDVLGVDISESALALSRHNQRKLLHGLEAATTGKLDANYDARLNSIKATRFTRGDILEDYVTRSHSSISKSLNRSGQLKWDILISNPPYISPRSFDRTTSRSVRNHEPKLALVPPVGYSRSDEEQGDLFYPRLLKIAEMVDANILLFEVADMDQAQRVAKVAQQYQRWEGVEIWRDEPEIHHNNIEGTSLSGVPVIGHGNGRAVFCYTRTGSDWVCKIP